MAATIDAAVAKKVCHPRRAWILLQMRGLDRASPIDLYRRLDPLAHFGTGLDSISNDMRELERVGLLKRDGVELVPGTGAVRHPFRLTEAFTGVLVDLADGIAQAGHSC